ncbi:MAG: dephospho-CoA kinase [Alphaproteobacteria bacterium]|nr:dephospho-CoA kinase [Alphaproteobacteria bacterium]
MKIVGLTGAMASGKSQTAAFFRAEGVPVFDADAAVHAMYGKAGEAVAPIAAAFPKAVIDGEVRRDLLSPIIVNDPSALSRLEAIVHPLLRQRERRFLADERRRGSGLVVLDLPLLFEMDREKDVDVIIVTTAPKDILRQRAFARSGMSEAKYARLTAARRPEEEILARAHYVIDTSKGLDYARQEARSIIAALRR